MADLHDVTEGAPWMEEDPTLEAPDSPDVPPEGDGKPVIDEDEARAMAEPEADG